MQKQRYIVLFSITLAVLLSLDVFAQDEVFSSPNVDYSFTLPDAKWKLTKRPAETSPNVEYVYGERMEGYMVVRKLTTQKDVLTSELIQDEEQKLHLLPGYVAVGKEENFAGRHRGVIFNYEYVYNGRPMGGRMYFLRTNDTTVYVLRFSGMKDKLRSIQNQTDSIARTFTTVPSK